MDTCATELRLEHVVEKISLQMTANCIMFPTARNIEFQRVGAATEKAVVPISQG